MFEQLLEHDEPLGSGLRQQARDQRGTGDKLQFAVGDLRGRVLGGHDLALLVQLDAPLDRALRLGENRDVRRPAATAERPAAAVKEDEAHAAGL